MVSSQALSQHSRGQAVGGGWMTRRPVAETTTSYGVMGIELGGNWKWRKRQDCVRESSCSW